MGPSAPEPHSRNFTSRGLLLRAGQRIKSTKLYQLVESTLRKMRKTKTARKQDMEFFREQRFAADAPAREVIYDNFQANLKQICQAARRSGAKALVSTVGVNLKDFPPLGSLHRSGLIDAEKARWESSLASGIAAEAAGQPTQAITNYLDAAH